MSSDPLSGERLELKVWLTTAIRPHTSGDARRSLDRAIANLERAFGYGPALVVIQAHGDAMARELPPGRDSVILRRLTAGDGYRYACVIAAKALGAEV